MENKPHKRFPFLSYPRSMLERRTSAVAQAGSLHNRSSAIDAKAGWQPALFFKPAGWQTVSLGAGWQPALRKPTGAVPALFIPAGWQLALRRFAASVCGFFAFAVVFFVTASVARALDWDRSEIEQHAGFDESLSPYVFTCANSGTATVTVTRILPSCGCLAPALDKNTLAAGESARLAVSLDRTGLAGEVERFVTIVTDEPNHNEYRLVVRADLPEALTLAPRLVFWKTGEEAKVKSIDIKVNLPSPDEITRATSNTDSVSVELVTLEAGRHYRLDITPRDTDAPRLAIITLQLAKPLPAGTARTVYAQVR